MSEFKLIKEANTVINEIAADELEMIREGMFAVFTYMKENPEQDFFEDSDLDILVEFDRADLDWMRELSAEQDAEKESRKSGVADEFEKRMSKDREAPKPDANTPVVKDVVKTPKGLYTIVGIDPSNGVAVLKNLRNNKFEAPLTSLKPAGFNKISGKNMFVYEG